MIEKDSKTGLWKHPQPVSKNSLNNTDEMIDNFSYNSVCVVSSFINDDMITLISFFDKSTNIITPQCQNAI